MITALIPMVLMAQGQPASIDALRWERRVLIVFAPSRGDARLARQRGLLDRRAMAERNLHVVEVVGNGVSGVREDAGRLRKRYEIGTGFAAVLIGKDGGVKLREAAPIAMKRLVETIDAMPMRAAEMHRR